MFKRGILGVNRRRVVAWRGSASWGDWLRNGENQFDVPYHIGTFEGQQVVVGFGYALRLIIQSPQLNTAIADCGTIQITGHSLGGGMATLHAYVLRDQSRLERIEAYNPARVGNLTFRTAFLRASNHPTQNMRFAARVFCRDGDPVWNVPFGFHHAGSHDNGGCTYWGDRLAHILIWKNHDMNAWL